MRRAHPDEASIVDVDASIVFRQPLLIVILVTGIAGAIDAVGYQHLGVFTANQAGNLVIGWTLLPEQPAAAMLAFVSLLGCGVGVAMTVLLRYWWPWLAGPNGSRTLLVVAAVLIVSAGALGEAIAPSSAQHAAATGALWSSTWWAAAATVATAAFSVAMLGMVFISGHGVRAPVLASTNAFVDAVRYGTAWTVDRSQGSWLRRARRAAAFPIAWSLGAAIAAFTVGVVGRLPVTATASLVLVGIALFARRVSEAAPHPDRTV